MKQKNLENQIKQKTKLLIEAKTRYNRLVRDVEKELKDKIDNLKNPYVHVSLDLASKVLNALNNDLSMLPDSIQDLQRILALTKEEAIENNSDTLQPLKSPIGSDSDFHISNDSIDKNVLPIQSKQIDNTSSDADYMDITQNESEDDVLQSSISLSESPIIKSKEQKSSSKSRFSTTSNNKLSNVSIDKQNQSIKSDLEEKSENISQLSSDLQSNKVSSEGSDAIIDEYVFDQSDNFSELNFESDENKLQTENEDLEILNEEEDFSDIDFSVSSGETPDLKGISLDVDQYLNQFEPKETIDIDEFVSN